VAQDDWLTLHWYIEEKNKFVPLEKQPRFKPCLQKYLIPANAFDGLRDGLQRVGISDAALFPDLGTLSKELVARSFPEI